MNKPQAFLLVSLLFVLLPAAHAQSPRAETGAGILPKAETGALRFLAEHPEADGRGVVVAILDSGIDPGAAGLQTTTDGKPKIIDLVDATGDGDVDTTATAKADDGMLSGLTGRQLKISDQWENPTGEFRLGIKWAYDFFPAGLTGRLKQDRRREWRKAHAAVEAEARQALADFDREHPSPKGDQAEQRKELRRRIDALEHLASHYEDAGPVYDCVLFHDGTRWRAVIDTDEDGDLAEEEVLTDFHAQKRFGTFHDGASLNFAVNIYDNGDLLSIVIDSHPHGTHVGSIVAGHFPEHPELNGLAPGAQLVSIKIGDARLDSMETGIAVARAVSAVARAECDLVNMSYGEAATLPDTGRLIGWCNELVREHGVIFVSSAGNNGPALSTVVAPGGMTSTIIGVGAYVSPAMASAEYALRREIGDQPFTWSSRGPTHDGALGIDIAAPGAAIAAVPHWTLQRKMQMNGTSMASPNACGNIALLLSAAKSRSVSYSPFSVLRAIQNTARQIESGDPFTTGPGVLQVERAWAHLEQFADAPAEQLELTVTLPRRDDARGILLRKSSETRVPFETQVRVKPQYRREAEHSQKLDLELPIRLEASRPWVECGRELVLTAAGETFEVRVEPQELEPGVHYAEVLGFDKARPERGPLFRVPITVMQTIPEPELTDARFDEVIHFTPEHRLIRRFFDVPRHATTARIEVLSASARTTRLFMLHTLQTPGGQWRREESRGEFLRLLPGMRKNVEVPVTDGQTMELCLAQYWASLGEANVELRVTFGGLKPTQHEVTLTAHQQRQTVLLTAGDRAEQLAPSARLTKRQQLLAPAKAKIQPLPSERDRLVDGTTAYELLLTYRFSQDSAGTVGLHVPASDGLLYESEYGGHTWHVFDANGRRVASDDVYPDDVSLGKGQHEVRVHFRHEDVSALEKLKATPMVIERALDSAMSLQLFATPAQALAGDTLDTPQLVQPGEQTSVVVAAPNRERLPTGVKPGDLLVGTIRYTPEGDDGWEPREFPLVYAVPQLDESANGGGTTDESAGQEETDAKMDPLERAIYQAKFEHLKGVSFEKDREAFDKLAAELLEAKPGDLDVLQLILHRLDDESHRKERLSKVVAAADAVLAQIDTEALAAELGRRSDADDPQSKKEQQAVQNRRDALIDALYRKGRALGYMELPDVIEKHPIEDKEAHDAAFEENYARLKRWVDPTDRQYVLLHVRRERRRGRLGESLYQLNRYIPDAEPNFWYYKKRRDLYGELGWEHAREYESRWLLRRFPDRDSARLESSRP